VGSETLGVAETVRRLLRKAGDDGVCQFRVGALIVRDGAVLLLRRAPHESFAGIFELPSGGVEPGEGVLEALMREVREETGLRVTAVPAFVGSFDYRTRAGEQARQFNFAVEVDGGEPRLEPAEHDRLAWARPDHLASAGVTLDVRSLLQRFWRLEG
jgi:8-oxo-dGTP diphosphatase